MKGVYRYVERLGLFKLQDSQIQCYYSFFDYKSWDEKYRRVHLSFEMCIQGVLAFGQMFVITMTMTVSRFRAWFMTHLSLD